MQGATVSAPGPPHAARLGYQPQLDGIRAAAVALVFLRHANAPVFDNGGTVGVGAFFALSGFLITTIINKEFQTKGRIELLSFYARRALRLVPALVIIVVASLVYMLLVAPKDCWGIAAAALTYTTNWARIFGLPDSPLGPTWSLAVEEHFYLLWPLLFMALSRRMRTASVAKVTALLAGAFAVERLGLVLAHASALRLQYGTDTRSDGLLLGCAVALWWSEHPIRVAPWAGYVCVLALGALAMAPGGRFMDVLGFSLIPVFTIALILCLVTTGGGYLGRVFGWRPLVATGRMSYGFYLYHALILTIAFRYLNGVPAAAVGLVVSLAVAWASRWWWEERFLRLKDRLPGSRHRQEDPGADVTAPLVSTS